MKLVALGIDDNSDLIMQFSELVPPYSESPLALYQIEIVLVPIIDQNTHANSNTESQISCPFIAINDEIHFS